MSLDHLIQNLNIREGDSNFKDHVTGQISEDSTNNFENPATSYGSLTIPVPKRAVDTSVLDSLLRDEHDGFTNAVGESSNNQFINNLFLDDFSNSSVMENSFKLSSRPASRLLTAIGPDSNNSLVSGHTLSDPKVKLDVRPNFNDSNLGYLGNLSVPQGNHAALNSSLDLNSSNLLLSDHMNNNSFFLNDNKSNIIRPASTPVVSSANIYQNSDILNRDPSLSSYIVDPVRHLNPSHMVQSSMFPSRSGNHLDSLIESRSFEMDPQRNSYSSGNLSGLGMQTSLSEHNLASRLPESERFYHRHQPGRNHISDGYHSPQPGRLVSSGYNYNPRQVSNPIYRSQVSVQNINSYRHSAAPDVRNVTKQGFHGSAHHHSNPSSHELDPFVVENLITITCKTILRDASCRALKAVELANTLRARVGTEVLAFVRENWGGLLSLLEKHPKLFRVDRIPKNDMVTLCEEPSRTDAVPDTTITNGINLGPIGSGSGIEENASIHSNYASSSNLDNLMADNTGNADMNGNVSKCLHVGNVPSHLTEKDLIKEFEKYGGVETVKLISQRGRRFAFVCFRTVEMAVHAKLILSRHHPWKSAISFAHRDFTNQNIIGDLNEWSNPKSRLTGSRQPSSASLTSNVFEPSTISPSRSVNVSPYPLGTFTPPPMNSFARPQSQQFNGSLSNSISSDYFPGDGSQTDGNPGQFRRVQTYAMGEHSNYYPNVQYDVETYNEASGHMYPQIAWNIEMNYPPHGHQAPLPTAMPSPYEPMIMRRLCDDTYVPTQAWPVDATNDIPFCQAIITQLSQFGGSTSISKLRGFLRTRISAPDNIKSVPLKALLAAYPQHFQVRNNQVTLLDPNPVMYQPTYGNIAPPGNPHVVSNMNSYGPPEAIFLQTYSQDYSYGGVSEEASPSSYRGQDLQPVDQISSSTDNLSYDNTGPEYSISDPNNLGQQFGDNSNLLNENMNDFLSNYSWMNQDQ